VCYCSQVYLNKKAFEKREFKTKECANGHILYAQFRTLGGLFKY
jgi:hypothetical protein